MRFSNELKAFDKKPEEANGYYMIKKICCANVGISIFIEKDFYQVIIQIDASMGQCSQTMAILVIDVSIVFQ